MPRDRDVVVVDQLLAAKAFPNESAIGKRILIRVRKLEPEWVEIIGVAAHVRGNSLAVPGREQVYFTDGYVDHGRVNRWALARERRPGAIGRGGPRRRGAARFPYGADGNAAHGHAGGTRTGRHAIPIAADRRVRRDRRNPGRRRPLWRAGDAGAAAHRRDRCPHGAGRSPGRYFPIDCRPRLAPQRRRESSWAWRLPQG